MYTHFKLVKADRTVNYISEAKCWASGFGGESKILGGVSVCKFKVKPTGYHQKTELLTNNINVAFSSEHNGVVTFDVTNEVVLEPGDVLYLYDGNTKVDTIRNQMNVIGYLPISTPTDVCYFILNQVGRDHESFKNFGDEYKKLIPLELVIFTDFVTRTLTRVNNNEIIHNDCIDYRYGYNDITLSEFFINYLSKYVSLVLNRSYSIGNEGYIFIRGKDNPNLP